jgi:rare lipoprotein A
MKKLISLGFLSISLSFFAANIFAQQYTGTASFYHTKFEGRKTATGAKFSNAALTCACNRLPLNTWIKVTNLANNKTVVVQVTDRLAANNKRVVDLTTRAAKELGFYNAGLAKVKVEVVKKKPQDENLTDEKANRIKVQLIDSTELIIDTIQ